MEISGPSTYNTSKAALTAYTKSVGRALALEKKCCYDCCGTWNSNYRKGSLE